jgi:hypothetical protein
MCRVAQSSIVVNYHFQSFRRPKSLSRFFLMQELPAQRSAKPLGSTSTNKATVCETVVSAVGDYFRVARDLSGIRSEAGRLPFPQGQCAVVLAQRHKQRPKAILGILFGLFLAPDASPQYVPTEWTQFFWRKGVFKYSLVCPSPLSPKLNWLGWWPLVKMEPVRSRS